MTKRRVGVPRECENNRGRKGDRDITGKKLERETRFELATFSLGRRRATTALLPHLSNYILTRIRHKVKIFNKQIFNKWFCLTGVSEVSSPKMLLIIMKELQSSQYLKQEAK
jgi:hypothetical protein